MAPAGAINRHKLGLPPLEQTYNSINITRGRGRGRGARARGSYSVPRGTYTATWSKGPAKNASGSVHKKLVLNKSHAADVTTYGKPTSNADTSSHDGQHAPISYSVIKPTSLSTAQDGQPSTSTLSNDTIISQKQTRAMHDPNVMKTHPTINSRRNIIIDGVTFISDSSGRKLVRKDCMTIHYSLAAEELACLHGTGLTDFTCPAHAGTSASNVPKNAHVSVGGQSYVRTKSSNLISADLAKRSVTEAKRKRLDNLVGIIKGVQKARGYKRLVLPSNTDR